MSMGSTKRKYVLLYIPLKKISHICTVESLEEFDPPVEEHYTSVRLSNNAEYMAKVLKIHGEFLWRYLAYKVSKILTVSFLCIDVLFLGYIKNKK